jgi:hypothetical protein
VHSGATDAIECVAPGILRGVRSGRIPPACPRPVLDDTARTAAVQALMRLREFLTVVSPDSMLRAGGRQNDAAVAPA